MEIAFGSAIFTLLVVGAISYRATVASSESARWVRHSHAVLYTLQDLLFAMESIESSYRGFELSGNESYLASYRTSILRAKQDEAALRNLTEDNSVQQRRLPDLEKLTDQKIEFAEIVISLRRAKGLQAAAQLTQGGLGQRIMDEFGGVVRELRNEEARLLELRDAEAERRTGRTKAVLILGTILGLFIAVTAGWSAQSDRSRRGLAAETLRDSEEKYRMLLDGVHDYAIFLLDPQGQVISWNAGAERMKGYRAEEIIGHNFSCFFPPQDIQRGGPEEILRLTTATGRYEEECNLVRKDGSGFYARVTLTALRDPSGNLRGFSEITRDLSERKGWGAKYRGLLEAAPDAMVVVNQSGEIALLNVQAEKQFGYHRDELVGKNVTSIIPKGFAERLIADGLRSVEDALAQQIGTGIELTGRRKDGSDFPIEIMLSPLESSEGILVTAAIRDISARQRAEEEHIRLMTAIEQATEGVVVTNAEGEIEYVNPAFSAMTGYSREEALGENTHILESGKQDAEFYNSMWATLHAGQAWRGEMINRRKDGTLYTEKVSITPVRNERGEITHNVAMKEDITARKLLEDQYRQAQKMEAVGRLAAGVAHDFNNLLTIINGYSELVLEQFGLTDPRRDHVTEIKSAGERAAGLTRQLLAFSRQQVLAPQVLDLNTLMANLTKLLKRLIGEDIELHFTAGPFPSMVKADQGLIEQILMNLAVNSRDAMPQGGKLTIEISNVKVDEAYGSTHYSIPAGSYVMVAISDTGCGMDRDVQAHIFEPFFTTKERGKGTGLGLATVHGIVEQSGGHIWVYSELGTGTTFKIYLPMVEGAPEAAKKSSPPQGGSETVLLVEDDASLRELARTILAAKGGYKVLESRGGKEAQMLAGQYHEPIYLLLTDVVMPGMSGRLLSEELVALRPEMKILFMSGYTDDTVVLHGVLKEGTEFIQKPFTPESLLRKVRDVLDAHAQA